MNAQSGSRASPGPIGSRLEEITRLLLEEVAERQRAEESFRTVVEEAPNGIVMVDRDGRIVLINKAAEALFGYGRHELIGELVEILVPQTQRRAHPQFRAKYLHSPESRPMGSGRELMAVRKDGTSFHVEIGLNPVETTAGVHILATIIDITERKRAEENFRAVVEEAPNGIVVVDAAGRVVLINKAAESLFGYSRQELLGQPVEFLVPEGQRQGHPGFRQAYLAAPEARPMGSGRDLMAVRKNGTSFPVEIGLNPVATSAGRWTLATIIDITERRRAEEHREMLMRELSHRVKNNLAVISSIARLTARASTTPELFYEAFSGRLQAIAAAHALLSASEWSGADLRALVQSVLLPFNSDDKAIHYAGPDVHVSPDLASPLSLILHELATNATKYGSLSNPAGRVCVGWRVSRRGAQQNLDLTWREENGPPAVAPLREGFGTSMMQQVIERQLGGAIETEFGESGLRCRLVIPLTYHVGRAAAG